MASCTHGHPSSMEYIRSITLLFITMKVIMYGMLWILILIFGTISKGLLNKNLTICKSNGVGWGGGNLNFCLNPIVITFTLHLPSKNTSFTIFFLTCTIITTIWWSIAVVTIVIVALEVVPSFRTDYLLVVVKYVLRLGANFNNWPMVIVILLSNIRCPTFFFDFQSNWG